MHADRDRARREDDAEGDEREQQRQFAAERLPRDLDRRLEHQGRQEYLEDQLGRQRQVEAERQQRQRDARDDEADRIGHADPPRQHRHQRGDEQQQPERGEVEIFHSPTMAQRRTALNPSSFGAG